VTAVRTAWPKQMHPSSPLSYRVHDLEPLLSQHWWVLFVRGGLAVAFGLATLVWPDLSLAVLIVFVGTWFFLDGVVAICQAFTSMQRWPHVLDGSLSIGAGAAAIFYPQMAGLALTLTIAFWLVTKGVAQVVLALRFGGTHPAAWLLGVLGVTTAGFGAFLAHDPADALGMMSLVSGFAVLMGLSLVALGWWFER
jgi:uncharacterized membrane protein HdeD (DUF308 family)